MHLRLATSSDLAAMADVLIGASPMDPVYPYRFPDRHLYPAEFAELCRRKCAEYLETSTVVVCELPVPGGYLSQVVAFAAWDMPPEAAAQVAGEVAGMGSSGCRSRRASAVGMLLVAFCFLNHHHHPPTLIPRSQSIDCWTPPRPDTNRPTQRPHR